jgi:hypothetical protein
MSSWENGGKTDAAAGEEQLRLQLQGLQHQVAQGRARVRKLIFLAGALVVVLVVVLLWLYLYHVLQYARLAELDITASTTRAGEANIHFVPLSEGRVEFVREAPNQVETLTEYAFPGTTSEESKQDFTWEGKEIEGYTITVRYRKGLSVVEHRWAPPRSDESSSRIKDRR